MVGRDARPTAFLYFHTFTTPLKTINQMSKAAYANIRIVCIVGWVFDPP
ncbi:MAG: hypothetical protein IJR44_06595 [Neisseriaceae bacterium]|nr:hypothetical protein [Neisseriaceae bacterium]